MSARTAAWAGLGIGAAALGLAGVLLQRTLTVTLEIRRYADEIAEVGGAIAANTDLAADLARMHAVAGDIRATAPGLQPPPRSGDGTT